MNLYSVNYQMKLSGKTLFIIALLVALLLHGSVLFFTFEKTYDAYVHIFFADHYASSWFDNWDYRWYTGFTVTSYPPLVHQVIALLSFVVGLKMGFYIWAMIIVLVFVRGIYHFSKLWVHELAAGYAALLAVMASSFVESLHLFGQLPSITGIAVLLNACPEIYKWVRFRSIPRLFSSLILLAVITSAHHVSTIFGMIFFVLPTMGLALIDNCIVAEDGLDNVKIKHFIYEVKNNIVRIILFGISSILITLCFVFAYWYWSKTDPISQVSIPHGSRDNYLEVLSSGLVFFLIPWGMMLLCLPYIFMQSWRKRNLFLGISISLAFFLGTGGTTPFPRMLLGATAFDILTLDRFTYWACIMSLPFFGDFVLQLTTGEIYQQLANKVSATFAKTIRFFFLFLLLISTAFILNIGYFRPLQPDPIDIDPITQFLSRDGHDNWRYLTLGFGDQLAWLSANTQAKTVDGNYHSARRLPELTTRSVERLENAKYRGMPGIGALQQFLTTPEKYHLKYIFCNDEFYEPILFYSGWNRKQQLENNIILWEYPDVSPLPTILPRKNIPAYQRIMWGVLPLTSLFLIILLRLYFLIREKDPLESAKSIYISSEKEKTSGKFWKIHISWMIVVLSIFLISMYRIWNNEKGYKTPENTITAYYDALDYKRFEDAYNYYDPANRPDREQYDLENSVENGILSSYAKLATINFSTITQTKDVVSLEVSTEWVTSLKSYNQKEIFQLIKRNNKWYIVYRDPNKKVAPDQFFNIPSIDFKNQGRRTIYNSKSSNEEKVDRPKAKILQANLIKKDTSYYIVGEILNTDNVPCYLSGEAIIYDPREIEIFRYNFSDVIKHIILPKEKTPFRIDLSVAIRQLEKSRNSQSAEIIPHKFSLFVKTMGTDQEIYPFTGISNLKISNNYIIGGLVNYGTREITIPQILFSYKDSENNNTWVDAHYMPEGVRPQKKKLLQVELPDLLDIILVYKGLKSRLIVNGVNMEEQVHIPTTVYNGIEHEDFRIETFINPFISSSTN